MNDVQTPADTPAGNEAVAAEVQTEAVETQDHASASQAAQNEAAPDAEAQQKTESETQKRRDQRRRALDAAREEARKAADAAAQANAALEQIRKAAQGREPPKPEQFASYDDFTIAAATYAARKAAAEDRQDGVSEQKQAAERAAEAARKRAAAEAAALFQEAAADARKRYADFDAVVFSDAVTIAPHVAEVIAHSDVSAELAYHVAKDAALAQRLSAMNPIEAARHLGRMEAQLSAPKPRIETRAPDPISPVRGTGGATRDPEKMTPAEYDAWRSAGGTWTR